MANVKLAQIYKTSVAAVFDQFRINNSDFDSLLLNRTLSLSWEEFRNVMIGQTVPFEGVSGLSYDLFEAFDWMNFTAEEWYGLLGSPKFHPVKASLFLRVGGLPYPAFEVTTQKVIDLTNHAAFTRGSFLVEVDDDGTGTGSMAVLPEAGIQQGADISSTTLNDLSLLPLDELGATGLTAYGSIPDFTGEDFASLSYPLRFMQDKLHTLWFRVRSQTTTFDFDVLINGETVGSVTSSTTADAWTWKSVTLLLPDRSVYTMSIAANKSGQYFDKLVITNTGYTPTGEGPDYDESPYVTAHVQLHETDDDQNPVAAIHTYDAKNSLYNILTDDWYNFDTDYQSSEEFSPEDEYAVVLRASGGSNSHFVMWDLAPPSVGMPAVSHDGTEWTIDEEHNHALLLYSNKTGTDGCSLEVRAAQEFDLWVRNFREEDAKMTNTTLFADEYGADGTVTLDLPDRVTTFVLDESGSSTWNDPERVRYDVVRRIVNRLDTAYPAESKYNLLKFGATKIVPVLFGSASEYKVGSASKIINDYFVNSSSTAIAGVRLVRKAGGYPQTPIDGTVIEDGLFNRYRDTGLQTGTTYYYSLFTYDQTYSRFSSPRRLTAVPRTKNVPLGITNFEATVHTGTGQSVSDHTVGLWHFDEKTGSHAYDFSPSSMVLTSYDAGIQTDAVWLDQIDVPMGMSGIRLNGSSQYLRSAATTVGACASKLTVTAWVYWYAAAGTIVSRQSGSNTNYVVSVDSSGKIKVTMDGSTFATSSGSLTANTWTHVAVTVDINAQSAKFYLDGTLDHTATLVTTTTSSGNMKVTIGATYADSAYFFGRLAEVGVEDQVVDAATIESYAETNIAEIQDNGDRTVSFKWFMADDSAGTVIIVNSDTEIPSNDSDYDVVYQNDHTAGEYVACHSTNFRVGSTQNYKIFVRNGSGNYSLYEDAALVTVDIPYISEQVGIPALWSELSPPTMFSATPIRNRVALEWVFPDDDRVVSVVVLVSASATPVVESLDIHTGEIVGIYGPEVLEYLYQVPDVDRTYYFTAVGVDQYGRISSGTTQTAQLSPTDELHTIDPPPVKSVRAELVNETEIEIVWENPIDFIDSFNSYIGDVTYLYGALLDEYGDIITGVRKCEMTQSSTVTVDSGDNVFGEATSTTSPSSLITLDASQKTDGLIRGYLQFNRSDPIVNKVAKSISSISIKSAYEADEQAASYNYTSKGMRVVYRSPLQVVLTNVNNDVISYRYRSHQSDNYNQIIESVVDGCYARRDTPITVRLEVTYRGEAVSQFSVNTISKHQPELGDVSYDPVERKTASDSFLDVSIDTPSSPELMTFYAKTALQGFTRTNYINLRYLNPLQIEISFTSPNGDGTSVTEQSASVVYVDPNDPDISSAVPNFTVVQWGIDDNTLPFYSTDNTRQPNGVYSYVRTGTARKVYVGPVDIPPTETRSAHMTATVVYDGLVSHDTVLLTMSPDQFSGTRFLSEFPAVQNSLWADGKDYVRLTIVHDPETTTSVFSDCFLDCSLDIDNEIIPLEQGQLVKVITADDFDIYWGDVVEHDDSNGSWIDVSGAKHAVKEATVPLTEDEVTYVYFRLNKTTLANYSLPKTPLNACQCFRASVSDDLHTSTVLLTTTVFNAGESVPMRSGGNGTTGMPPLYITPKEPLSIRAVDLRVDGIPSDAFIIDGTSVNEIVYEVSWRGAAVPDGTIVNFSVIDGNDIQLLSNKGLTEARIDTYLNAEGPLKSFVSIRCEPVASLSAFTNKIKAEISYSGGGVILRKKEALVSIVYSGENTPNRDNSIVASNFAKYSVGSNSWSNLPSLEFPRAGLSLAYASSKFFAIGGANGRSMSNVIEVYESGAWGEADKLNVARAYSQTVVSGGKVYIIGGIAVDGLNDKFYITPSVEVYNPSNDTCSLLTSMPSIDIGEAEERSYGVAMGTAVVSSGRIYIFGGATEVSDDGKKITKLNDRVLIYNISGDSWTYSTPFVGNELERYQRVGAYIALDGTVANVMGGVWVDVDEDTTTHSQTLHYERLPYSLTVASSSAATVKATYASSDDDSRHIVSNRYKGASVVIGTNVYFVGGSTSEFGTIDVLESYDMSPSVWTHAMLSSLDLGVNSLGAATDGTDLYVCGGLSSGRDDAFLQINISGPSTMRLDGKQSATLKYDLRDRNNNQPATLNLLVNGEVSPPSGTELYGTNPVAVVFSDRQVDFDGEVGANVLQPRGDDIVLANQNDSGVTINKGSGHEITMVPLAINAVIEDGVYKGTTAEPIEADDTVTSGVFLSGTNVIVQSAVTKSENDSGIFFSNPSNGPFDFLPKAMSAGKTFVVDSYSDIDWIPTVETLVGDNAGTASEIKEALEELAKETPIGCSQLLDALSAGIATMQDNDVASYSKSIYCLTDADKNLDYENFATVKAELKSLKGTYPATFVGIDLSLQQPLLETNTKRTSSDPLMEELAVATGGQTVSVINTDDMDSVVDDVTGRVLGAIGYGIFEYKINLLELSVLKSIQMDFLVTTNSEITWKYALSQNGFVYEKWSEALGPTETAEFNGVTAKWIKFSITLASGLTESSEEAHEDEAAAELPALRGINIVFNKTLSDYVFLNNATLEGIVDDMVVAVNANHPTATELLVGASTYNHFNWDRYNTLAMPARENNGKMVLPYRLFHPVTSSSDTWPREKLIETDGYVYKARYGRWMPNADVTVYREDGTEVDSDLYQPFADEGMIVMKKRGSGDYYLSVVDAKQVKLGMKVASRLGTSSVLINGAGVMYTKKNV